MNRSRIVRIDVELHDSCNAGYKPLFSKDFSGRSWQLWVYKIPEMQKWLPELAKHAALIVVNCTQ